MTGYHAFRYKDSACVHINILKEWLSFLFSLQLFNVFRAGCDSYLCARDKVLPLTTVFSPRVYMSLRKVSLLISTSIYTASLGSSPWKRRKKYVLCTREMLQTCQSSIISFCSILNSEVQLERLLSSSSIGSRPTSLTHFDSLWCSGSASWTCYIQQAHISHKLRKCYLIPFKQCV